MIRSVLSVAVAALVWVSHAVAADVQLRIGWPAPALAYGNPYSRDEGGGLRAAIFDSLTLVDRYGALSPALADSWEIRSPTTWVFKLHPGVVFANGEPFNAASVVTNLNMLLAPGVTGTMPRAVEIATIDRVDAPDDLTVVIHTKEPDPLLARRLNMISMVPPKAWAEMGVEGFARNPIGTGPYRIADWVEDNKRIRMTVVPTSWRKVRQITDFEVLVVPEPASRLKALFSGQLDIIMGIAPDDMATVQQEGFVTRVFAGNSVLSIAYRNVREDNAPLKDPRVRIALNYAVDKQAIVDTILAGTTRVASQGVAYGMPGYNPDIAPYPYDPAKAKALLAEAGYPNGFPMTISVYGGLLPNDSLIFQKMAQDLNAVGVKAELRPMVFSEYARRLFNGDWKGIDAFSNGWLGTGVGDPIRAIDQFSCRYPAPFFCEPSVLPSIDATRTEMDAAKREALLRNVMLELNKVGVALWLVEFSTITAASPRVQNFDSRDFGFKYEDITLKN